MATSKSYFDFIIDQLSLLDNITCRQMMGEYLIYYCKKLCAYVCDDRLLVKILPSTQKLLANAQKQKPYDGAKDMYLVEDVDDKEFLRDLFEAMFPELPYPQRKKN